MVSREAVLGPKEAAGVIDIAEMPSYTSGPDDSLNTFFNGMDMSTLKNFSVLGHLGVPKKNVPSGAGKPSSSPKLVNSSLPRVWTPT